jgi:hypothetical protein
MQRSLLNLAAALSLLLSAATAALWVRSTCAYDCLYRNGQESFFQAHQAHGVLMVGLGQKCHKESFGWSHGQHVLRPRRIYRWASRGPAGFSLHFEKMTSNCYGQNVWCAAAPHWFLLSLLATPAAWRTASRVRRTLRYRAGHCATCGYDLRASPERCPECGSIPRHAGH